MWQYAMMQAYARFRSTSETFFDHALSIVSTAITKIITIKFSAAMVVEAMMYGTFELNSGVGTMGLNVLFNGDQGPA